MNRFEEDSPLEIDTPPIPAIVWVMFIILLWPISFLVYFAITKGHQQERQSAKQTRIISVYNTNALFHNKTYLVEGITTEVWIDRTNTTYFLNQVNAGVTHEDIAEFTLPWDLQIGSYYRAAQVGTNWLMEEVPGPSRGPQTLPK
ncbi:MAG: hypothetical protein Q7R88_00225 [bacterium]|nr:hypothetical protein [bacterium]